MDKFNTVLFKGSTWENFFRLAGMGEDDYNNITSQLDFPHIMALTKTKLLVGKGYTFETESDDLETFWSKFVKDSRFQQKLGTIAYRTFKRGSGVVGFDVLKDGSYRVFVTSDARKPYITKAYEDIIGISYWKETTTSTSQKLVIQEDWTDKKVKRAYYYNHQQVNNLSELIDVPKHYILPEEEPNKFGFIPFHDFQNYEWSELPDWFGMQQKIFDYNKEIEYYRRELKLNKSFIAINANKKNYEGLVEAIKLKKTPEYFIQADSVISEKPPVEKMDANLPFSELKNAISQSLTEIFSLAGMSYTGSTTSSGDTTATETSLNASGMNKTIELSRTAFNANMNIFLEKIFNSAGFQNVDFTFSLNENSAITDAELLNSTISKIQAGLISRVAGIATIQNIPMTEAEEQLGIINEEAVSEQNLLSPKDQGDKDEKKKDEDR